MTDQSLFNTNENPQATPEQTSYPLDALNTQLADIKNSDGAQKYKNLEDALNALKHSQDYIPQVKEELTSTRSELDALKQQVGAVSKVEDLVSQLAEQKSQTTENTTQEVGLDEQAVLNLINKVSTEKALANQKEANVEKVNSAIASKFGDKSQEV